MVSKPRSRSLRPIAKVNASGMGDFGKVMGAVMPQVKGKADGNLVNQTVKAQLNQ